MNFSPGVQKGQPAAPAALAMRHLSLEKKADHDVPQIPQDTEKRFTARFEWDGVVFGPRRARCEQCRQGDPTAVCENLVFHFAHELLLSPGH